MSTKNTRALRTIHRIHLRTAPSCATHEPPRVGDRAGAAHGFLPTPRARSVLAKTTSSRGLSTRCVGHPADQATGENPMRSEVFEIRYPDGDFEIAATQVHSLPVVGDQFRRKDRLWRVT